MDDLKQIDKDNINNTEETAPFSKLISSSFGLVGSTPSTSLFSSSEFITADDIPATIYIISTKNKGFRPDAFYNSFEKFYHIEEYYMSQNALPEIYKPLCFIIDITDDVSTLSVQQNLLYIQEKAIESGKKIFLLGMPENLAVAMNLFSSEVSVKEFERPVDMRECIKEIEKYLTLGETEEKKKHIFVVDDSPTFLHLMKSVLEKEYKITTCKSASACLKELAKNVPDMIITDYEMPICDAYTMCQMIREDTPQVPIICYSANANTDEIIKIMPYTQGFLLKSEKKPPDILEFIKNYFSIK